MSRELRQEHEYYRRSLVRGVAHAKAKEKITARRYLNEVHNGNAKRRHRAEAAYWLARMSDTKEEAADWLESCLAAEPGYAAAQRALMVLEGHLKKEEIINPDRLAAQDTTTKDAVGDRHECPKCGGYMAYLADGDTLVCEHCGHNTAQNETIEVEERSFAMAMATAKGHHAPVAMQFFECRACGANYQLAPETLTLTCVHCNSTYTIEQTETKELMPPDGIIPFDTDHKQAESRAIKWLRKKNVEDYKHLVITGVYLPMWTFDIGGALDWTAQIYNSGKDSWETQRGTKAVFYNDLPVYASKPIQKRLKKTLTTFDTESAKPYDAEYTANWMAETYQITMSDAALNARAEALKQSKVIIRENVFGRSRQLSVYSTGLSIETFKLLLVPVWIGHYVHEEITYEFFINGDNLALSGSRPPTRIQQFFNWVVGK